MNPDKESGCVLKSKESRSRQDYLLEDDEKILKYLMIKDRHLITSGSTVWKNAEKYKVTNHTWQSMKNRFQKTILPNLGSYICIDSRTRNAFDNLLSLQPSSTNVLPKKKRKNLLSDDIYRLTDDRENVETAVENVETAVGNVETMVENVETAVENVETVVENVETVMETHSHSADMKICTKSRKMMNQNVEKDSLINSNKNVRGEAEAIEVNQNSLTDEGQEISSSSQTSDTSTPDSELSIITSTRKYMKKFLKDMRSRESSADEEDVIEPGEVVVISEEVMVEPEEDVVEPEKADNYLSNEFSIQDSQLGSSSRREFESPSRSQLSKSFANDMKKLELALKWLNVPPWVLNGALYFNNGDLDDAIYWLLNSSTKSGAQIFTHKDDRLLLGASENQLSMLRKKYGTKTVSRRLTFLKQFHKSR